MLRSKPKPPKRSPKPPAESNGNLGLADVLTLAEAAAYLRASAEDVLRLIETDDLPARKVGADWRFYKAALQDWLSHPPKKGWFKHFGAAKDDPYLEEMLKDIYARRGRPEIEEP